MSLPIKYATCCCLRRRDETLFMDYREYPHPLHAGLFSLPGGKLRENETPEQGVAREVLEETGIMVHSLIFRGAILFLNERRTFGGKPAKDNWKVHIFDSYDFDDSQVRASEGRLAWVQNEKAPSLKMHEGDKVIWNWMKQYSRFDAEIVHEGEKLVKANLIHVTI